jgi:serine/threonine-protein kinase Chk2
MDLTTQGYPYEDRLHYIRDADLIAQVYPYEDDNLFLYARSAIENSSRCMPPRLPQQQQEEALQGRSSRESTLPPEDRNHPDTLPYLEVRFSHAPRTSSGLVFGTDQNICDVVLPRIERISKRHFALTYKNNFADGCSRLIVRDLGSRHGTIVTYDRKGGKPRSEFDWILDGFDPPNKTKTFIVRLHDNLKFRIVVARHDIISPAYANNVERFRQGAANPQDLLHGLGLQSGPETERNSRAQTPVRHPILLQLGRIGYGGFGVVSRHWNVSTGEEYACKQPVDRKYDREAWEKEINIMGGISHVSNTAEGSIKHCTHSKHIPRVILSGSAFLGHRRRLFCTWNTWRSGTSRMSIARPISHTRNA